MTILNQKVDTGADKISNGPRITGRVVYGGGHLRRRCYCVSSQFLNSSYCNNNSIYRCATYDSSWPFRTMFGPLPMMVPMPPIDAEYDTPSFSAQAKHRNSESSFSQKLSHSLSATSPGDFTSTLLYIAEQSVSVG